MDLTNPPAEGGSYEMVNGKRVLVERTAGEGRRGTTDTCPALDPAEAAGGPPAAGPSETTEPPELPG